MEKQPVVEEAAGRAVGGEHACLLGLAVQLVEVCRRPGLVSCPTAGRVERKEPLVG